MKPQSPPKLRPRFSWLQKPNYPFPLLYYLECILVGVALLTFLSPTGRRPPFARPMMETPWQDAFFPMGGLLVILSFVALAWVIPIRRAHWKKVAYTLAGFGLCWLFALAPRVTLPFSALLLGVVMRSCLYLQWPGRITVAIAAFSSFLLRTGLYVLGIMNRLRFEGRPSFGPRRFDSGEFQGFLIQLGVGSALFFGLVLLFVLLLVGTLMNEYQGRQKLAMANQRLRRYSLLVEDQATLQERSRIARELHDSIGHCLTAQSIQLENVALWFDRNQDKAKEHLQTARTLSREALSSVRQSVSSLRQEPMNGLAFPEAIAALLQNYGQSTKLPIESQIQIQETIPKEIAIALYRIVQESLTNIVKHAQAKHVTVALNETPDSYHLCIQDDGRGFTLATNQRGFGLTSMRERVEALKGSFRIHSEPGQGCTIWVEIPRVGGVM